MTVPVIHSSGDLAPKRLDAIEIEKMELAKQLATLLAEEKQLRGHMLPQIAMRAAP